MNRISAVLLAALLLPAYASPQGFGDDWLELVHDDSLLVGHPSVAHDDVEEKDYAVGDFDHDGLADLVVARKEPLHTTGKRRNILFLNLGGVLTESTQAYASASDVPGDQGFLTPTNDRDVVAVDVDLDGWLDVVTATTLSPNEPKHVSHPRVYRNLGQDTNGDWRGFRHEDARIPQLLLADGTPSWPRFTAVATGDVTGDGFPDLYFGDNDKKPGLRGGDMNDRLLVNDGTGHFVDESALRMAQAGLGEFFTTSAQIVDLNLDGEADIVRDRGYFSPLSIAYNDPSNVGFFATTQEIAGNEPYYATAGDLNRDERPDLVISDNGPDRFRYNEATLGGGAVLWSAPSFFEFLVDGDDGFGSDSYIADLDLDGWNDVLICDFDVELPGCGRRLHVYHNAGGTIGGPVTLREEAEMASGGWRGALGLNPADVSGTHDAALIDLEGDGDLDLVLGRCAGTEVFVNQTLPADPPVGTSYCDCDPLEAPCGNPGGPGAGCANSTGAGARVEGRGSASVGADDLRLSATGLVPGQPGLAFAGDDALNNGDGLPFGDGLRCAGGGVVRLGVRTASGGGAATFGPGLAATGGWSPGDVRRFQVWYRDPSGGPCDSGFNLSSALEVVFSG